MTNIHPLDIHPAPATAPQRQHRHGRRRLLVGAVVFAILTAITAAVLALRPNPADGEAVAGVTDVTVVDNAFEPPVIEVLAGTTVTWTYAGDSEHNLVGDDGWGDETPRSSGTVTEAFDQPGTYRYSCTLHGGMTGRVDVVAR